MKASVCAALVLLGSAVGLASDPPYAGTWKVDVAKSTLAGDTATISSAPGGMLQFDAQGFIYSFRTDGKEYPTPDGGTTAWTATAADVWDVTNHLNGKIDATYHLAVKADTLTVSGKLMKGDGGSLDFGSTYKRVGTGTGFVGKWKSVDVKPPTTTLLIAANGANGVMMTDDTGPVCSGQFDSKDNPALGMGAGSKNTFAFRKVNASSFEVTTKLDGKSMFVDLYTVSADGKTLTDSGTPTNAKNEPYKVVFVRQ